MLGMAETRPLDRHAPNSAALLHELIELGRLGFADRDQWVADPAFHEPPLARLLAPDYLASRAALVPATAGGGRAPGFTPDPTMADGLSGDTVYLSAVDADGNAVSWIQSLFGSFGSRLVEPETGVVLHNRGAGFSLEDGHPNQVAPGKRPFHTLMATLITGTGEAPADRPFVMTIGTPGGSGQPQFVTQALVEMELFGRSPQQAVEAPRYRMGAGRSIDLEGRLAGPTAVGLEERGHEVTLEPDWTANFGSLTVIRRMPNGVLRTGADMRREAAALAW
jgi:gamma-glutamyltranspeptidase/glutathione hydrolase